MTDNLDFEWIFEHAPNPYVLLTPDLTIVAANAAYRDVTASRAEELIGRKFLEVFPHDPDDPENASARQLRESLERVLAHGLVDTLALISYRVPERTPDGREPKERYWSATHTPIFDRGGGRMRWILQHTVDVTHMQPRQERMHAFSDPSAELPDGRDVRHLEASVFHRAKTVQEANRSLDAERSYLRELFEQAPGFTAIVRGPEYMIELANAACRDMLGRQDMVGRTIREALPELLDQGILRMLNRVRDTGERFIGQGMRVRFQHSDGTAEQRFLDFVCQPIGEREGREAGILVQGHDVTDQKRAQDIVTRALEESEIERSRTLYLSQHDSLTELPNRATFHSELDRAVMSCRESNQSLSLFFIDIDRFKSVNDSLGHHIGDRLLQAVAERLTERVRSTDFVARLSGDEFGVISVGDEEPGALASDLVRSLSRPFFFDGQRVITGVSIGTTMYPRDATAPTRLLINADRAMYHAKYNGRSTHEPYTPVLDTDARRRHAIKQAVARALASGGMSLRYQPQFDLVTEEVVSAEALVRLAVEEVPDLTAGEIISVAENSGLIIELGEWILREACSQAGEWQRDGRPPLPVTVNVSSHQFVDEGFPALVDEVLSSAGLPPQCLELEVSQGILVEDNRLAIPLLKDLKQRGITISIDDFGTGFSSLGYLKQFPMDKLKIDRLFVGGVADCPQDATIATAIVNMAHGLGMSVIAEGVENEAQLAFLRRVGCDIGQGFLFSKALPARLLAERYLARD